MGLNDLTLAAVLSALGEYDALGRDAFLRAYGFKRAREYFVVRDGRRYDSKAIAGVAHKFAMPMVGPLRPADFSGGEFTVARVLERLGFSVEGPPVIGGALPDLRSGHTYTWDELGRAFDFNPSLFQVGGGMLSRPELNALLLITHPGGARSFDYEDRWDGDTLIYTGRGKNGDQRLEGPNRDVAENRKRLVVLEAVETKRLRYLGEATCLESWVARAADAQGNQRDVWKFRLGFARPVVPSAPAIPEPRSALRRPRPFSPVQSSRREPVRTDRATPEEIAALQEKANREHCRVVARLAELLVSAGWTGIEEIPAAVDLWGTSPDGNGRVLFEVKTLSGSNEVHQCRAGLSQLLEYRFFYGTESDRVCIVLNGPIADRRRALFEDLDVAIVVITDDGTATSIGRIAHTWFGRSLFLVVPPANSV